MKLSEKVAVVTGGSSGIGESIVKALAKQGARVGIGYRSHPEAAESTAQQIEKEGGRAVAIQGDVSVVDDLEKLIGQTIAAFGRLDVMVNNAGIETRTSTLETSEAEYDRVMAVNLKSAFFGTQLAAKQMIEQGDGGRIINISSIHEDWPMPGNTPYCLSKGGMRMLTRTAGVELAPHGITVVGVGPGAVATPINVRTMTDPDLMKELNATIPIGRMAETSEIADLVAWLASDVASYIAATTIFVDGGMMQFSAGL
ncbi:MAG: SDR family NAD(P)-dependent oxidoreductase [Anaerolineales bacterium]